MNKLKSRSADLLAVDVKYEAQNSRFHVPRWGASVFCKPFHTALHLNIGTLEAAFENEIDFSLDTSFRIPVIIEREGIHYINQDVLDASYESARELDNDFKKLVDSIIG